MSPDTASRSSSCGCAKISVCPPLLNSRRHLAPVGDEKLRVRCRARDSRLANSNSPPQSCQLAAPRRLSSILAALMTHSRPFTSAPRITVQAVIGCAQIVRHIATLTSSLICCFKSSTCSDILAPLPKLTLGIYLVARTASIDCPGVTASVIGETLDARVELSQAARDRPNS